MMLFMASYAFGKGKRFENDDSSAETHKAAFSAETNPGGKQPVKWVIIERTSGLIPAQIIAERLVFEGIPARAIQEGAGAFGLTVGILGEGRVLVPEHREEEARKILDEIADEPIEWEVEDDESEI